MNLYIMNKVKESLKKANQFEIDMHKYFSIDLSPFMQIDELIYALELIFNDHLDGFIDYWVYDLECGEKTEVIEYHAKKVFLCSIDDLYQLLIGEPNYV